MSYTSYVEGNAGDEKVAQSTRINGLPLGTEMRLPGGRVFVHAKASATALVAGNLYQQEAETNALFRTGATCATTAIGATSVTLTVSGTVLAANEYRDGYLYVASTVGTGGGLTYKVKDHKAAASTETVAINLEPNDSILVAFAGGTTTVGLRSNEYQNVLLTATGTSWSGVVAGVAPRAVTANFFCWLQKKGPAAVLTDGSLLVGVPVVASTAVAGAVGVFVSSTTAVIKNQNSLGTCMQVAASTGFSLVNLSIP